MGLSVNPLGAFINTRATRANSALQHTHTHTIAKYLTIFVHSLTCKVAHFESGITLLHLCVVKFAENNLFFLLIIFSLNLPKTFEYRFLCLNLNTPQRVFCASVYFPGVRKSCRMSVFWKLHFCSEEMHLGYYRSQWTNLTIFFGVCLPCCCSEKQLNQKRRSEQTQSSTFIGRRVDPTFSQDFLEVLVPSHSTSLACH